MKNYQTTFWFSGYICYENTAETEEEAEAIAEKQFSEFEKNCFEADKFETDETDTWEI